MYPLLPAFYLDDIPFPPGAIIDHASGNLAAHLIGAGFQVDETKMPLCIAQGAGHHSRSVCTGMNRFNQHPRVRGHAIEGEQDTFDTEGFSQDQVEEAVLTHGHGQIQRSGAQVPLGGSQLTTPAHVGERQHIAANSVCPDQPDLPTSLFQAYLRIEERLTGGIGDDSREHGRQDQLFCRRQRGGNAPGIAFALTVPCCWRAVSGILGIEIPQAYQTLFLSPQAQMHGRADLRCRTRHTPDPDFVHLTLEIGILFPVRPPQEVVLAIADGCEAACKRACSHQHAVDVQLHAGRPGYCRDVVPCACLQKIRNPNVVQLIGTHINKGDCSYRRQNEA